MTATAVSPTDEEMAAVIGSIEEGHASAPAEPAAPPPPASAALIDPAKLAADVTVNPENLDDAMTTHASMFVHYAVQSSRALRTFKRLKAAFEILESRLDNEYRASLKEANPKTTEAQIKAAIQNDKRWSGAQARLIDAETEMRLADDAKEAFTQRKDMILEMARDRRKEKEGQLRVMAGDAARESVLGILRDAGVKNAI